MGLRLLVHEHLKTLVMFTVDHCVACEQLRPIFELFATNKAYADITFLRLDADQNPVAQQALLQPHALLLSSDDQGRLGHCDTLYAEQQLRAKLYALHQHALWWRLRLLPARWAPPPAWVGGTRGPVSSPPKRKPTF